MNKLKYIIIGFTILFIIAGLIEWKIPVRNNTVADTNTIIKVNDSEVSTGVYANSGYGYNK
jgi:hypothetical protein